MILRQNAPKIHSDHEKNVISPPDINKGGKSQEPTFTAIVDYLTFTYKPESDSRSIEPRPFSTIEHSHFYETRDLLIYLGNFVHGLTFAKSQNGYCGYKHTLNLFRHSQPCGKAAYGGNNDTVMISLTGLGCQLVDMKPIQSVLETLPSIRITRVDLAHDDLEGGKSLNDWIQIAENGEFTGQGRPPQTRKVINSDIGTGNTLYVGHKKNGKEACIYEKGKQLGNPTSPHVRIEVRIYNKDRIIPLNVLTEPAKFLAATYPPLHFLSAVYEKIKIVKDVLTTTAAKLAFHAKRSYGKLITWMSDEGYEPHEIVALLSKKGHPQRIKAAQSILFGQVA